GVDETLDPARFALLPVPRRTLVLGMLAAAFVGVPPVVTLLATLGSVIGAVIDGGIAAGIVAVLGAAVGICVCVAASRAVTGAVVLLWWWLQTIESAMLGATSGPGARRRAASDERPVRAFIPGIVRFLPTGRFAGLLGREIRYWLRDPRRRASLISLLAAAVVIPFAFTFGATSGRPGGAAGITSVIAPYPMPDSNSPFAMNTGRGSAKSLLSFVSMLATWVLTAPLSVAFTLLPDAWSWTLLPIGVAWGLAAAWLG